MREWVVMLRARSSVRLTGDPTLAIMAGPGSTPTIKGARVRNCFSRVDEALLVTGLLAEAWGLAETSSEAVSLLAPRAAPLFALVAVAANASVDEPDEVLVYAPPFPGQPGRFLQQKPISTALPPPSIRSIGIESVTELAGHLQDHPEDARLRRAAEHHRQALRARDPFNTLMSAQHLYVASENLGPVAFHRLCREAGLEPSGQAKHQLAVAAGFVPPDAKSRRHLNDFDAHVRRTEIFEGDRVLYSNLSDASEGFEHGFASFDKLNDAAAASADAAMRAVRRAILREAGVPPASPLFDEMLDSPVGGWQPRLQVEGTYESSRVDEWPTFYGTAMYPEIVSLQDINEAGGRQATLKMNITGESLLDGQKINLESRLWVIANAPERKAGSAEWTEEVGRAAPDDSAD